MKELIKKAISWLVLFKKKITPFWLQWSFFPKVGQPPLQSFVEIAFYLFIVYYCTNLFLDFNRIPENVINLEYDRLNDYRYLSRGSQNDSTVYLHYQAAKIGISIPMVAMKSDDTKYLGTNRWSISDDSMRLVVSKNRLKTKLNNYWLALLTMAVKADSTIEIINEFGQTVIYEYADYGAWLGRLKPSKGADAGYEQLRRMLPDSLSKAMKNHYRIKLSTNYIGSNKGVNVRDSSWHAEPGTDKEEYPYHKWFLDDNGMDLLNFHQFEIYRTSSEQLDSTQFVCLEGMISNNRSSQMDARFNELCKVKYPNMLIINRGLGEMALVFH